MKFGNFRHRPSPRGRQRGYMLITIVLLVALLAISLVSMAPDMKTQIRRDREEEMIRRGTEYARAIQKFQRKFGRFPSRVEELESTNGIRFLRRKFKDPITGQDWQMLRYGDPKLAQGIPALGRGGAVGTPVGSLAGQTQRPGQRTGTTSPTGGGTSSSFGTSFSPGQVLGGGPIVGVISTSKEESIREFADKSQYDEWLFLGIATSQVGLIKGPYVPNQNALFGSPGMPGMPGVPGMPGATGSVGMPNIPGMPAGMGGTSPAVPLGGQPPRR